MNNVKMCKTGFLVLGLASGSWAGENPSAPGTPVDKAIEGFGRFFKEASTLQAEVRIEQTVRSMKKEGVVEKSRTVLSVAMKKQGFYRETTTDSSNRETVGSVVLMDGKTKWEYSLSLNMNQAYAIPYEDDPGVPPLDSLAAGQHFLRRFHSLSDPAQALKMLMQSPCLGAAETIDGVDCMVLKFNVQYPGVTREASIALRKGDFAPVRVVLPTESGRGEIDSRFPGIETNIDLARDCFQLPAGVEVAEVEISDMLPPEGIEESLKIIKEKRDALREKYRKEGVRADEIDARVNEALDNDPELKHAIDITGARRSFMNPDGSPLRLNPSGAPAGGSSGSGR